jgi:hypothetical protein
MFFAGRRGGFFLIIGLLVGLIIGYVFGTNISTFNSATANDLIQQLRAESQNLKRQVLDQNAKLGEIQTKLTSVQAILNEIMPSDNTYSLKPNQSVTAAGGHLSIGLIGSPTNESININVNGKQQSAVTGDVIRTEVDPSMSCQVRVQSFDMFKAVVTAFCEAAKTQQQQ